MSLDWEEWKTARVRHRTMRHLSFDTAGLEAGQGH